MKLNPALSDSKHDGVTALVMAGLGFFAIGGIDSLPGRHAIPVAAVWLGILLFPIVVAPVMAIGASVRAYRAEPLWWLSLLLALIALAVSGWNYFSFAWTCARRFGVSWWVPWH